MRASANCWSSRSALHTQAHASPRDTVGVRHRLATGARLFHPGSKSRARVGARIRASVAAGNDVFAYSAEQHARRAEIQRLSALTDRLRSAKSTQQKISILEDEPRAGDNRLAVWLRVLESASLPDLSEACFLLRLLFAMGQQHVLPAVPPGVTPCVTALQQLSSMLDTLRACERFYDVLGGVAGYQLTALTLIDAHDHGADNSHGDAPRLDEMSTFYVPVGPDLVEDPAFAAVSAAAGLLATPFLGELYPVGGAGDRLGLLDEATGEPLPAALLPYNGHTLLECLLRDLAAREYLHFRLTGIQVTTPVVIMTSAAKGNHSHVLALCERNKWFNRGADNFRIFQQPLVPVLKADTHGTWLLSAPGLPVLKPGGHGTVWKLAQDTGALDWLASRGVRSLLVRQISNPLAATDNTLLALAGIGTTGSKAFGFVSCARTPGAAEGVNVLVERHVADKTTGSSAYKYHVSAMEYTEFGRLGIPDVACERSGNAFPANTNVMFVSLDAVNVALGSGAEGALPGMLMNLSKPTEAWGEAAPVRAGRLECSMQNLVDCLPAHRADDRLAPAQWRDLDTFVVYTARRRVTSSAKRRRHSESDTRLAQTPEGSCLDYLRNAADMLALGNVSVPAVASNDEYVRNGGRPGFLFRSHPALGPLWHVTAQKVRSSVLHGGSELELELAEVDVAQVDLDGSLIIKATHPLGVASSAIQDNMLAYSSTACGRARLHRVVVRNRGVEWDSPASQRFWSGDVPRRECVTIVIHGDGEFDAKDVTLSGAHAFEVPPGHILELRPSSSAEAFTAVLSPKAVPGQPTWMWQYAMQQDGRVLLTHCEALAAPG